jgi:hypothetical protein
MSLWFVKCVGTQALQTLLSDNLPGGVEVELRAFGLGSCKLKQVPCGFGRSNPFQNDEVMLSLDVCTWTRCADAWPCKRSRVLGRSRRRALSKAQRQAATLQACRDQAWH